MSVKNDKKLNYQELNKEILKFQTLIRKIRFSRGMKEKNVKKMKELKKEIARLETIRRSSNF